MTERTSVKSLNERTDNRFIVRRGIAAVALGTTVAFGFAAHDPVTRLVEGVSQQWRENQALTQFGRPVADIKKDLAEGKIDPSSFTVVTVKNTDENPTSIAERLHLDNKVDAAFMLGDQIGDSHALTAGQELYVPNVLKIPQNK